MKTINTNTVTDLVIIELIKRNGFFDWWNSVGKKNQNEIVENIDRVILKWKKDLNTELNWN